MKHFALLVLFLTACGDNKAVVDIGERFGGAASSAPVSGDWYRPTPSTSWQWQLTVNSGDELNTSYDVEVYDIDLFDNTAATIQALHASGRKVICYFSAGSFENWRPDAPEFLDADIGKKLDGWKGERWLDIRSEAVFELMTARLDIAVERGCDAVEPDNVDGFTNATGFDLDREDQLAFNKALANAAREQGLAIGLKNTGDLAPQLEPYFDFSLNEECHRFDECAQLRPFTESNKPIWNAEYTKKDDLTAAEELATTVCPAATAANIRSLILPLDLDDRFRVSCD